MEQLSSWFSPVAPTGSPADGFLLAQIFFPTNKSYLDARDRRVLSELETYVRRAMVRGERVELTIIGHADYRGSDLANQRLGYVRAKAVARELALHFQGQPNFSVYAVVSQGEQRASQNALTAQALAKDRRVDVWSEPPRSYRLPELPQLEDVPRLLRVTHRHFLDFKAKPAQDPTEKPDSLAPVLDLLVEKLFPNPLLETAPGSPVPGVESAPEYRWIDARHRVNFVRIRAVWSLSRKSGSEFESYESDVDYEWGPPLPIVTVRMTETSLVYGFTPTHRPVKIIRLTREAADKSKFYFPPPLVITER